MPYYQEIPRAGIPEAATQDGLASVHVIAGAAPGARAVVQYGPFVTNTEREITEAIEDYRAGRLGAIAR